MSSKNNYLNSLNLGFDQDLLDVMDRCFGTTTTLTTPTTVSDAIITNAQVAVNFNNNYLVPLSGVPIVKLMLHIGQRNKTLQHLLLSNLKLEDIAHQSCAGTLPEDYIRIKDLPESAGYGIFQGMGGDPFPSELTMADKTIPEAMWTAQNGVIEKQSEYLGHMKDVINAKFINLPNIGQTRDSLIGSLLSDLFGEAVGFFKGLIWGVIAGQVFGQLWDIISYLKTILTNYASVCDAMKAENTAMLTISSSREHYQLRNEVLERHYHAIDAILTNLNNADQQIISIDDKLPKGWKEWTEELDEAGDLLSEFLGDAYEAADVNYDEVPGNDLPVPSPPKLPVPPNVPDRGNVALIHIIRFALRLLIEHKRRQIDKEAGKNHEEMIRALKNIQAELTNVKTTLDKMDGSIVDLQFNDEVIDFGSLRILLKGKTISY